MPPTGSQPRRWSPIAAVSSPRMTSVPPTVSRAAWSGPERTPGIRTTGRLVTEGNVCRSSRAASSLAPAGAGTCATPRKPSDEVSIPAATTTLGRHGTGSASPSARTPLTRPRSAASRRCGYSSRAVSRAPTVVLRFRHDLLALNQPDAGVGGLALEQDGRCPDSSPWFPWSPWSEIVFQGELHLPRTAGGAGDAAAGGGVDGGVGRVEARRVGQVESLGAEHQAMRADPELLEQREVECLVAVLAQDAAAGIAVGELGRNGERRLVEPRVDGRVVEGAGAEPVGRCAPTPVLARSTEIVGVKGRPLRQM